MRRKNSLLYVAFAKSSIGLPLARSAGNIALIEKRKSCEKNGKVWVKPLQKIGKCGIIYSDKILFLDRKAYKSNRKEQVKENGRQ